MEGTKYPMRTVASYHTGIVTLSDDISSHYIEGLQSYSHIWILFIQNNTINMKLAKIDGVKDKIISITPMQPMPEGVAIVDIKPFMPEDGADNYTP